MVDGFGVFDLSLANFVTVLGNPNVHLALANSLIACAGGTALAVAIGLAFPGSWCAPTRRAGASSRGEPDPAVRAAAGRRRRLVDPRLAEIPINTLMKWIGLDWRIDLYSMTGLIVVFGMYYAPYVYMFTASALRNMDPDLEEAAEIAGVGPSARCSPSPSR